MGPDRLIPAKLQFTIGRVMCVIAVFAVFLATTPSGLAAVVMFSLGAFYYALYRYVLPGRSLPKRRSALTRMSQDL
jgi:hypothetical protein